MAEFIIGIFRWLDWPALTVCLPIALWQLYIDLRSQKGGKI
jgi:hypothetical protein